MVMLPRSVQTSDPVARTGERAQRAVGALGIRDRESPGPAIIAVGGNVDEERFGRRREQRPVAQQRRRQEDQTRMDSHTDFRRRAKSNASPGFLRLSRNQCDLDGDNREEAIGWASNLLGRSGEFPRCAGGLTFQNPCHRLEEKSVFKHGGNGAAEYDSGGIRISIAEKRLPVGICLNLLLKVLKGEAVGFANSELRGLLNR